MRLFESLPTDVTLVKRPSCCPHHLVPSRPHLFPSVSVAEDLAMNTCNFFQATHPGRNCWIPCSWENEDFFFLVPIPSSPESVRFMRAMYLELLPASPREKRKWWDRRRGCSTVDGRVGFTPESHLRHKSPCLMGHSSFTCKMGKVGLNFSGLL